MEWDQSSDVEGVFDVVVSKDETLRAIRLSLGTTKTFDVVVTLSHDAFRRLLATAFAVAAQHGLVELEAFDTKTGKPMGTAVTATMVAKVSEALSGKDKAH